MDGSTVFMYLLSAGFVGTVMMGGAAAAETNLKTTASRYSVTETIKRIEKAVVGKGMLTFARINHGEEAKKVGLEMKPTILLIFGNPKGGDRANGRSTDGSHRPSHESPGMGRQGR